MKITTTLIAMLLAWPLMGQAAIGSMAVEENRNATAVKADTTTTDTNQQKATDEKKIFSNPETMPQFPGGTKALAKYLSTKIKYPQEARKAGAQGRVILSFIVGADGSISNVKTLKSVHPALDAEAIRREILEQGPEDCRIQLIDAPIVDISSTEIREREAAGDDMSGFLM